MAAQNIAAAMRRAQAAYQRRPAAALRDDATAVTRWQGGTRIVAVHPNGARVLTDMSPELGGTGDQVSPGWLLRAGLASCAATLIAMCAAAEGMELAALEVVADSRSDVRGLLGMSQADGHPVDAAMQGLRLRVAVSAPQVPAPRLRALVDAAIRRSPVYASVRHALAMDVQITVDDA